MTSSTQQKNRSPKSRSRDISNSSSRKSPNTSKNSLPKTNTPTTKTAQKAFLADKQGRYETPISEDMSPMARWLSQEPHNEPWSIFKVVDSGMVYEIAELETGRSDKFEENRSIEVEHRSLQDQENLKY